MLRNRSLSSAFHGFVSAVQNQVHTSMYTYIHENTHTHTHIQTLWLSPALPPHPSFRSHSLSHTQCGRWRVEKWQCLPSTIGCAHPCRQLLTIGYELRLSANVHTFGGRKRDKEKTEGGRGRERRSRLHHSIQVTYTDSMRLEHSQMGMLIAKERLADVGEVVGREAVKLFSKAADDFSQNLGGGCGSKCKFSLLAFSGTWCSYGALTSSAAG